MIRKIIFGLSLLVLSACGKDVQPASEPIQSPPSNSTLAAALGIAEAVDLRENDGPIVSQFGKACSTFATAAAMNNALKRKGINKLVSERHLWATYGSYDVDAAVKAASKNFITEEKRWPSDSPIPTDENYQEHASLKITQYKNLEYNIYSALRGLSYGHSLVMAIVTPKSMEKCDSYIDPNSGVGKGEHTLAVVGYQLDDSISGGGYFILKNSWGPDCGDKGYHYFPISICKRSGFYCYFNEIVDVEDRS